MIVPAPNPFGKPGMADRICQIRQDIIRQISQGADTAERSGRALFRMILPFMVSAQLRPVAHVNIRRQSVQIAPESILILWGIKFSVANVQTEIVFGGCGCNGLK